VKSRIAGDADRETVDNEFSEPVQKKPEKLCKSGGTEDADASMSSGSALLLCREKSAIPVFLTRTNADTRGGLERLSQMGYTE
jgi:hypothetical protein